MIGPKPGGGRGGGEMSVAVSSHVLGTKDRALIRTICTVIRIDMWLRRSSKRLEERKRRADTATKQTADPIEQCLLTGGACEFNQTKQACTMRYVGE